MVRPRKDPSPFPFGYRCWIITHEHICEKLPKSPASVCIPFHKTFHLQNRSRLEFPKKQTTSDPIKYHGRTTRQGGAPSLPPRPPLVSQSKYFSLFSNPDSCKNSSIIIILIIIYKNRSSFSLFLSFSKCIFSSKEIFSLATVLFFFLKLLNVSSGKLTHPLPHPIYLNPREERHYVLFAIQNKNNVRNSFFSPT